MNSATHPSAGPVAARLLEYRHGHFVAFAAHATLELVDRPPLVEVPTAPYYCLGLMAWQDRHIPLLDLYTLLRAYPEESPAHAGHVLVLRYQSGPGQPLEYGALCAPALVHLIQVADSQQCPLPGDSDLWEWIAPSCFEHNGHAVPILDAARIFSQPYL